MHSKPKFLGGVVKASDVEKLAIPEGKRVAFAGRSNVGKSSLLNALTASGAARVSAVPGKTREMNFFAWKSLVLVDLPGYGYAKVRMKLRDEWGKEIAKWIKTDPALTLVVALVDGRHGFLPNDVELIEFLVSAQVSFVVAFTKMDKWKSNNQRRTAELELKRVASELGVIDYIYVSSTSKAGIHPLEKLLREL